MLNIMKGDESSCKANFTRYSCANRDRACKFSLPSVTKTFTSWTSLAFPFRLPLSMVALKKKLFVTSSRGRRFNTIA